ncbi:hypothetical protein [Labedaea rhizosphaerae]|uniref:DUF4352 domain-containing protein n=1 Tax=Labedaea rhizosphaerae TaxID=598644 RepID=A0A4R6S257_LABRH|nr:hypothetical protein [Labedaea rhizosphaerae]TDP93630.1 hypothetical protein EV186_10624 [Labedaea rhizosphaerae]
MRVTRIVAAVAAGFAVLTTAGCLDDAGKGTVSDGSGTNAAATKNGGSGQDGTATWGKRYTWPDGLAVEVAKPVTCKPSEYSSPQHPPRAVLITILVVNGTKENFDPGVLSVGGDAQFNGEKAEPLFDSDGGCDDTTSTSATVLPGKTYKVKLAFVVGKGTGDFQLALQPNITAAKAVFVGKA